MAGDRGSRAGLLHAFFIEALDAGANTDDAPVFDEQLLRIRAGDGYELGAILYSARTGAAPRTARSWTTC